MKNVYIMALEPIETRYTSQWLLTIPIEIRKRGCDAFSIFGEINPNLKPVDGAFLNFTATNVWKSEQVIKLCRFIEYSTSKKTVYGKMKDGDHIFWPDAWHPGILQARYMIDLLGLDVKMSGYWHAGSYDPEDFLGRGIKNKDWSYSAERSFFHALDYNFFATQYHADLFCSNLSIPNNSDKIILSGQPHNALLEKCYSSNEKEDLILFPHRIAPEKQLCIFKELAKMLPQYQWEVCQEKTLTKDQYHNLLARSKMVFSANLQETLGISCMEAILSGSFPLVPDRLSYKEMYLPEFKYPSEWSGPDWPKYLDKIAARVVEVMSNDYSNVLADQKAILKEKYLLADKMFEVISQ